jgi:tetratricopeptide (TPR) repeat protein
MSAGIITKEEALTSLLHAAAFMAERLESVDGMSEAMNEIVPRFIEAGDVDTAAALADLTADPLTRDRLLVLVAEKCIEKRDDEYGLQLVEAIDDLSLAAGATERIALKMIERGDIEDALRIASKLGHPDEVLRLAAIEKYRVGAFEESLSIASTIEAPATKTSLAMSLVKLASDSGSQIEIDNQLKNAERHAADIDLLEESLTFLIEIGNLCIEIGRSDLAIGIFEKARTQVEALSWPHRDNLLAAIAVGLFAAGSVSLADIALDLVTDKSVVARTLSTFSHYLRKQGSESDAVEVLDEAHEILKSQKEKEIRDFRSDNAAWRLVALQYALSAESEKCISVVNDMPDAESQSVAASQCAVVFASSTSDETWRELFKKIDEPITRAATLIAISEDWIKNDRIEEATQLLEECGKMVEEIDQPIASCGVLTDMVSIFMKMGETGRASEKLGEAISVCSSIVNTSNQAVALARLSSKVDSDKLALTEKISETLRFVTR